MTAVLWVTFAALSLLVCTVDLREHRIPDRINGGGLAVIAAMSAVSGNTPSLRAAATSACIATLGAWFLSLLGRGALGLGDVKLTPTLGWMIGWTHGPERLWWWTLVVVGCFALAVTALLVGHRTCPSSQRPRAPWPEGWSTAEFAAGPWLILATWIVLLAPESLG